MNVVLPSDAKRWTASRRAKSSNTLHGVTRHKHRGAHNRRFNPRSLRWGLHKLEEQVLMTPLAIEHRPHGQNDGQSEIGRSDGHREGTGGWKSCVSTLRSCGNLENTRYKNDSY